MPGRPGSDTSLSDYFHRNLSVSKTIYRETGIECMPQPRPLKRRKTLGLNARFDHMLSQVNATHSYNSDPKARRKRVRSSGSSSVSSCDLPKTPVDAYSHLHEDKLREDFSALKANKVTPELSKSSLVQCGPGVRIKSYEKSYQAHAQTSIEALPSWLASTFSALEPEHPLRELLPPSLLHEDRVEARTGNKPPQGAIENDMFAFWPFDTGVSGKSDASHEAPLHLPATDNGFLPCNLGDVNTEIQTYHHGKDLGFRPFSTPGTLTILPHTGISKATSKLSNPPGSQQLVAHLFNHFSHNGTSLGASNAIFTPPPILYHTRPELPDPDLQESKLSMDIFSTPGPTHPVYQPVHFDSPTEDPSQYHTLEPEPCVFDLNALDFRWRPFLQKSLPNHGLTNPPNSSLHAPDIFPIVFEELDSPSPHLPDTRVRTDPNRLLRGSLVSGHATQQTLGQSAEGALTPVSGVAIPSLRNATASPKFADVKNGQVKTERPTANSPEGNRPIAFQPELVSAANRHVKNHEEPFTPPRPTQTSQPATPKKDRQSQPHSVQGPPPQERRSSVSWMLLRGSLAALDTTDHEEIEGLLSQRSDASHDTIESWTDNH